METIAIVVNGKPLDVAANSTVQELLARFSLPPVRVAVEKNRQIVPRKSFAAERLTQGDRVEIVTFVGGG